MDNLIVGIFPPASFRLFIDEEVDLSTYYVATTRSECYVFSGFYEILGIDYYDPLWELPAPIVTENLFSHNPRHSCV